MLQFDHIIIILQDLTKYILHDLTIYSARFDHIYWHDLTIYSARFDHIYIARFDHIYIARFDHVYSARFDHIYCTIWPYIVHDLTIYILHDLTIYTHNEVCPYMWEDFVHIFNIAHIFIIILPIYFTLRILSVLECHTKPSLG